MRADEFMAQLANDEGYQRGRATRGSSTLRSATSAATGTTTGRVQKSRDTLK